MTRILPAALRATAAACLVAAAAVAAPAAAQYPDHPIRMVVPYPPGGATDVMARAVAQRLGERLKQSVVVDNKPGASGQIGSDIAGKAPADGYTVVFTAADTHSINPHVYPKIAYDAKRDFAPVGMVGYLPLALIVNPNVKANDLKQFIALAKASPGKMTFASYGVGSSSQVAMEMLNQKEGMSLLHVPFQGAAPAVTAVMAGQVDAMMVPLTVAWPNHQAGKVRVLGVAAPKRFVGAAEVPTFTEQGVDLVSAPWIGILAPAKTPADMIDRLSRETVAVVEDPQIQETLVKNGLQPDAKKAADFRTFLDAEYDRWGATVKAANIKAE